MPPAAKVEECRQKDDSQNAEVSDANDLHSSQEGGHNYNPVFTDRCENLPLCSSHVSQPRVLRGNSSSFRLKKPSGPGLPARYSTLVASSNTKLHVPSEPN
jgi:hypothetical protein